MTLEFFRWAIVCLHTWSYLLEPTTLWYKENAAQNVQHLRWVFGSFEQQTDLLILWLFFLQIPPGGINLYANILHTHVVGMWSLLILIMCSLNMVTLLVGIGLTVQHIRRTQACGNDYQELEPIDQNLQYDFNYQQATYLPRLVNVQPVRVVLNCYVMFTHNFFSGWHFTLGVQLQHYYEGRCCAGMSEFTDSIELFSFILSSLPTGWWEYSGRDVSHILVLLPQSWPGFLHYSNSNWWARCLSAFPQ